MYVHVWVCVFAFNIFWFKHRTGDIISLQLHSNFSIFPKFSLLCSRRREDPSVSVCEYVCICVCFGFNKGHFLEIFFIFTLLFTLADGRHALHVSDTDRLLMSDVLLMYIFCYCESDFPHFLSSFNQPFTLSVCVSGGHGYMQRRGEPSGERSRANKRIRMGRK